jgi:hypothetical protein
MPNAGLMRVKPGYQRGPCRTTAGGIVELREAHSTGGKCVQIWRMDFPAVAADIRVSHIIRHYQHDILPLLFFCQRLGRIHASRNGKRRCSKSHCFDETPTSVML